jgi:hypothetical protein
MTRVMMRTQVYNPTVDKVIENSDKEAYQQQPLPEELNWSEPGKIAILNYSPTLEKFLKGEQLDYEMGFIVLFTNREYKLDCGAVPNYFIDILAEGKGNADCVNPRPLMWNPDTFIKNKSFGFGHNHPTGAETKFGEQDKEFLTGAYRFRPHILFAQNEDRQLVAQMYLPGKGKYQINPEDIHITPVVNDDREIMDLRD